MKKSRYNYLVQNKTRHALLLITRNHALIELDESTVGQYLSNTLDSATIQAMTELGFFIQDSADELADLQLERDQYCKNPTSMTLTIMVTERCNFRCPYCYQKHNPIDLSVEKTRALCDFIKKNA